MINKDYHVHTDYVDGKDDPEAVVIKAIELGMKEIGFSEHAHVPFDSKYSLSIDKTNSYITKIRNLKKKYEGVINILCGIEMDYYSDDRAENYDYVIGSIHYLKVGEEIFLIDFSPEHTDYCINKAFKGSREDFLKCYYEKVALLKEKTEANIIGHLDVISKFENRGIDLSEADNNVKPYWENAITALSGKCVFEVNTGGMSRGYKTVPYPDEEKLKFIFKTGGNVVINSDSHSKNTLLYEFENVSGFLRSIGFEKFGFTDNENIKHCQ